MDAPDGSDQQIILELTGLARGFDPYGRRIPMADQMQAIQRLEEIKRRRDDSALAQNRFVADVEIEHRRLDIEQDRVSVEKAAVLVKALEVAASAGIPGERLLEAIAQLSNKLLPDRAIPLTEARMLTEKK